MRGIANYHKCVVLTNPVGAIHESPVFEFYYVANSPTNTNLSYYNSKEFRVVTILNFVT